MSTLTDAKIFIVIALLAVPFFYLYMFTSDMLFIEIGLLLLAIDLLYGVYRHPKLRCR